jgi:Outer membrane protein beta-barrel domain
MKQLCLALILGLSWACARAADSDPSGFYIGGAVGRSDVRLTIPYLPEPFADFDEHATGGKLLAGIRPASFLGAEFEYVYFGHPNRTVTLGQYASHSDILKRAPALSSLLYLPIPVPNLGVYAKTGAGRLGSSGSSYSTCTGLCPQIIIPPLRTSGTETEFLYSAGVQVKFSMLAYRVEYERVNDNQGSPDLLSVGVLWTF